MDMNPMQIIAQIKQGKNPQQLMLGMLESQAQQNPIYANLLDLAKQNRTQDIEQFARNLAKEKGIDFDKEFNSFKKNLGF